METVGGFDERLHVALDYDLWWRTYCAVGPLLFADAFVVVNREYAQTKTRRNRRDHYREAIAVVREHRCRVPLKWSIVQPYVIGCVAASRRIALIRLRAELECSRGRAPKRSGNRPARIARAVQPKGRVL